MLRALLIGNGEKISDLKKWAAQADFVLAADGGVDNALAQGVVPDLVIGDLDSASQTARRKLPADKFLLIDNQNNTDLEKAFTYLQKKNFKSCTLVGFLGGRWDFSLGNLLALTRFARKMEITIIGQNWQGFLITRTRRFETAPGKRVSLIPLKTCQGVGLQGLKFPLKNARLSVGTTRSLSNQTTGKFFRVSLQSGLLFVYVEN